MPAQHRASPHIAHNDLSAETEIAVTHGDGGRARCLGGDHALRGHGDRPDRLNDECRRDERRVAICRAVLRIEIRSATGQLLTQLPENQWIEGNWNLDLSEYPSGVYFVNILVDGQPVSRKLTVLK